MDQLRPTSAARHASPATFIHKDLLDSTHVFLRQDSVRRALDPLYSGPHKIIARSDKTHFPCAAGRSLSQPTESSPPTYWKKPSTTPAAHQPSPAVFQQNLSQHQFNHPGLHVPGALYTSRIVSLPKFYTPQGGDVGTPTYQYSVSHHNSEHPSIHWPWQQLLNHLFSTPFHITPNTHPYTDPDNSCLTISSVQSSVTHQ